MSNDPAAYSSIRRVEEGTGSPYMRNPLSSLILVLATSLNVKSGQTIRFLARESDFGATPVGEMRGFFPEILLTLK